MPDVLAHYVVSYLISRRIAKTKYALAISIFGVLPDVDVLFGVHRWITHSITVAAIVTSLILITLKFMDKHKSILIHVLLAFTLYSLHIFLDLFTASTPILWPITSQAYMLQVELTGTIIQGQEITLTPNIEVYVGPVDFTVHHEIEGPLISPIGVILAITLITLLVIEHLYNYKKRKP